MSYIDEAAQRSEHIVVGIEKDKNIPASTKDLLRRYVRFLKANGRTDRTINKRLYSFAVFLRAIGNKEIMTAYKDGKLRSALTKEEIQDAIAILERSDYSPRTKVDFKVATKALYKHFLGEDEYYPPEVRWLKTTLKESKKLLPEHILLEEDVLKMLEATTDPRNKALIALLFDSGIRLGELLGLHVNDIDLASEPAHVVVNGKTGMRRIPIMFSVPYLAHYLNGYRANRKPDEFLWLGQGSWTSMNHPIDRAAIVKILVLAAQKAGIQKRVNPHSFRHARATYYANRLTEQQLKVFFGWTGGSKMASIYVHLSGRDLDNSILQANGYKVQELQEPKLKAKLCPRCRYTNGVDLLYCGRCGSPLSIEVAMAQEKSNDIMKAYINDPLVLGRIAKAEEKKRKAIKNIENIVGKL